MPSNQKNVELKKKHYQYFDLKNGNRASRYAKQYLKIPEYPAIFPRVNHKRENKFKGDLVPGR